MLVTTEQAAKATGLSAYELRMGWKQGKYPALVIGNGGARPRLRWRLDLLNVAIEKAATAREENEAAAILDAWTEKKAAQAKAQRG